MSDLVKTVAADLKYLEAQMDSWVDDDSLRRASPIIRRLIVQNDLQRAWKAAGLSHEPRIRTPTLDRLIKEMPLRSIKFATVGGAKYRKIHIAELVKLDPPPTDDERKRLEEAGLPVRVVGLREYLTTAAVIVNGKCISRRVVIKYIANKLGGVHFDLGRRDGRDGALYKLLDEANRWTIQLTVDGDASTTKPIVYFELLSAAQALVSSDDVRVFVARFT